MDSVYASDIKDVASTSPNELVIGGVKRESGDGHGCRSWPLSLAGIAHVYVPLRKEGEHCSLAMLRLGSEARSSSAPPHLRS
jgi:hypothetical protein